MSAYIIQWKAWKDKDGARKFFEQRKAHMKITSIWWVKTGAEINLNLSGGIEYKESPILIWLN